MKDKNINLQVNEQLYREFKKEAVGIGITIKKALSEAIKDWLGKTKQRGIK